MTTYAYVALEPSGRKKTGFVDASDRDAAIASIVAEGRYVVEIKEQKGTATKSPEEAAKHGKVSRADLALFTRRMADLSAAGLPLDRVLQVVAEQSESAQLTAIAESALLDVRGGTPVSHALAKFPKYFPEVFTQTLRAGEASGQFPEVATRLADFQEKEVARRSQIVSAMVYPVILTCTSFFVITFLLTFVVPKLAGVFDKMGNDLPVTTKMLFAITGFLTQRGLIILGSIVGLVLFYRVWVKTDQGALMRDRAIMKIPVAGPIILKAVVSRFARVLGMLVYGGVPILEAIEIAGMSAGNRVFRSRSDVVEREVREGRSIAQAMRDAAVFPPVLTHMVAIGEETGDLPKMLGRVSDSLDFEVDNGMRRLTSMVEPIIILFMGGFVGFVVLSVLLPIVQAQDIVNK